MIRIINLILRRKQTKSLIIKGIERNRIYSGEIFLKLADDINKRTD